MNTKFLWVCFSAHWILKVIKSWQKTQGFSPGMNATALRGVGMGNPHEKGIQREKQCFSRGDVRGLKPPTSGVGRMGRPGTQCLSVFHAPTSLFDI